MKWSVSTTKLFQSCPRKYYYQQIVADKKSDELRAKEALYLKSLQSIYAWRGNLTDGVISRYIVPKINAKEEFDEQMILLHAKELMRNDLERIKDSIGTRNITNSFGFFELEYGKEITGEFIAKIENDIITSLKNLLASDLYRQIIEDQSYLIAQRTIRFSIDDLKIACTPDLIVFPKNDSAPKIIDWKVESVYREHWLQLGIYGYVLSKIEPHRDFPYKWRGFICDPRNINLIEYQLLRNEQGHYQLKDEDIIDIEDYIYVSSSKIAKIIGDGKQFEINQFPTTGNPDMCKRCQYKKLCWREMNQ